MPRPSFVLRLAVAAFLAVAPAAVQALTVVPPASFDALVAEAEVIARGVVTNVRAEEFDSPDGRGVRTLVTLQVERALKGAPGGTLTLTLLGGTVGRRTLGVPGMPVFRVGERQVVFVSANGQTFCPLVRIGHGRYHIRTDATTGRDYIARDNLAPLTSVEQVVLPLSGPAVVAQLSAPAAGLSPAAFETAIASTVAQQALARSTR